MFGQKSGKCLVCGKRDFRDNLLQRRGVYIEEVHMHRACMKQHPAAHGSRAEDKHAAPEMPLGKRMDGAENRIAALQQELGTMHERIDGILAKQRHKKRPRKET